MIEPVEADLGRKVVYHSAGGEVTEEGVITSFNDYFVFVRYGNERLSKATRRERLYWAEVRDGKVWPG